MNDTIKASDIKSMQEKFQNIKSSPIFYIYPHPWKELQLRPQKFREFVLYLSARGYKKVLLIKSISR